MRMEKLRVNYIWQWDFIWELKGDWQQMPPKNWEWVKDPTTKFDAYIDLGAYKVKNDNRRKIFIAIESGGHYNDLHKWIINNYFLFNYIFTFDKELLKLPNAKFIPIGGIWYVSNIKPEEKTKLISFCCTKKKIIPSHIERIKLANLIYNKVDMMGDYFGSLNTTQEIYEPYKYNIVFECEHTDLYFTEKLINCFTNRTVPINYGCTNLEKFGFDTNGIIQVNSIDEIVQLINSDFDWNGFYDKPEVRKAIEHNYNQAFKYARFEDYILENYPEIITELTRD